MTDLLAKSIVGNLNSFAVFRDPPLSVLCLLEDDRVAALIYDD